MMTHKKQPVKVKFDKQTTTLPIMNFDNRIPKQNLKKRHGKLLPNSIRAIFCSPSNC
ncbi:hypothetical protein PV326_001581, partial [Microctonus aethiopoides]